jgi:LmbE family N-acetylglucosaminyl deacetylase
VDLMATERGILAIYAHPDDAEIWAGGTLLAHRAAGDRTAVCILTHGDSPRAAEAGEGAALLGATLHHFALPDRALRADAAAVEVVATVLRAERPNIVLTHWERDWHPDHVATWEIVRASIMLAEVENEVHGLFWSDTYNGVGARGIFEPDCLVDVSGVWDAKLAAIGAHRSQLSDDYAEMIGRQCGMHGVRGGVAYAEGFRRVPLFGRARRAAPNLWPHL